jgi:cellulose synthase/poly-beta-1,6-N-acetylglucosamine synthase-like glycosyltransferase
MAFRVSSLSEIGGFDTSLELSEDTEICWRLHARPAGARIMSRPEAVVDHQFDAELGSVLRRAWRYGHGTARMAGAGHDIKLIVYPFPVAVAAGVLASLAPPSSRRRRGRWARIAALPLLTYSGWSALAVRERRLEPLAYPYLQMALEVATMAGEADALIQRRRG